MWRTDLLEKTLMLGKIEPGGEGDDRGWDGWMASPTRWTWVWANSRSWWWTGKPGMLQSMGSHRVRHDWETELNWTFVLIIRPTQKNNSSYYCQVFFFFSWIIRVYFPIIMDHSEKAMAPHSSTLAWKIPWMEETGRLQSMRSLRIRHDWATSLSLFTFMHWRRKWQPTPVFLPGESQGQRSLVGGCLWGCTESDTTEVT